MAVVDTEYYDLLGVQPDVNDADLKKAYRKQAIRYHPDKNKAADAEEKFKEISKAYQILADPATRSSYDKYGKNKIETTSAGEDPSAFFASVFGGEAFIDIIGEISLMKEMTTTAEVMMTEDEKEAYEKEKYGVVDGTSQGTPEVNKIGDGKTPERQGSPTGKTAADDKKGRAKLSPEQKAKLRELEEERRKNMEKRVATLADKLKARIEPYVEAKNPGAKTDADTSAWDDKMKAEAEELKYESFGVELLHTIGNIYIIKSTSFLKSRKFLGIPGFFSRLKDKGSMAKDIWKIIGSAMEVQVIMDDMTKLAEKGDATEEDMRQMEMNVTGKILLASWRGTKFEVGHVLREVCDKVLAKEPGVSDSVLFHRANALLTLGVLYKSIQPDESPEERRELERLVAEAAKPKKKSHHGRAEKEKDRVQAQDMVA